MKKLELLPLKVKIVSLALEARYIRQQEQKLYPSKQKRKLYRKILKGNEASVEARARLERELAKAKNEKRIALRNSLREHRTEDVRSEARSAIIAYLYLLGYKYNRIEQPRANNAPDLMRVARIATKFGGEEVTATMLREWTKEA